jgi:hypothetical protein
MSNTPENSSWKDNRVKRRKLFSGEEGSQGTEAESHSSNEQRAGRLERASTSKNVDAVEMRNSVVEEGNCFYKVNKEICVRCLTTINPLHMLFVECSTVLCQTMP